MTKNSRCSVYTADSYALLEEHHKNRLTFLANTWSIFLLDYLPTTGHFIYINDHIFILSMFSYPFHWLSFSGSALKFTFGLDGLINYLLLVQVRGLVYTELKYPSSGTDLRGCE